jgi:hypothetical protein
MATVYHIPAGISTGKIKQQDEMLPRKNAGDTLSEKN